MRARVLILAALLAQSLAATPVAAQAPADSTKPRSSPVYLVAMLEAHNALVTTSGSGGTDGEASEGLGSLDLSIQPARKTGVGLALRTLGGPYDYADLALLLGNRAFALDLGAASRSGHNEFTDEPNDTTYRFARIGFRSRANLGNSDLSLTMRILGYVNIPTPEEEILPSDLNGLSAETGLSWTRSKWGVPWTVALTYRVERFEVFGVETLSSSLSIGGGVVIGRGSRAR